VDLTQLQYGNLASWLAFAAACIAVSFTWRALMRERRRDEAREQREKREQADNVAAWIDYHEENNVRNHYLAIQNASGLPIFNVRVFIIVSLKNAAPCEFLYPVVGPGRTELGDINADAQADIKTSKMKTYRRDDFPGYGARMDFTDMAGIRWRRNEKGQLTERKPELRKKRRTAPDEPLETRE